LQQALQELQIGGTQFNVLGPGMTSELWRKRLLYTVMSLFVAWHSLALIIPPLPDNSDSIQFLRSILNPYLTLFRLDNGWAFFAPDVGKGQQLHYIVEDAARKDHKIVPYGDRGPFDPAAIWYRIWYDVVIDMPDDYAQGAGDIFCRKHADMNPVAITLLRVDEQEFTPADHLAGKHPLDPEFVQVSTVKRVACPH
jgi:hypothetical protein